MRASHERLLIVLIVAVLALGLVFVVASAVTQPKGHAAVDRLKDSEAFQRQQQKHHEKVAPGSPHVKTEGEPTAMQPSASATQKERIAAFAHLSERVGAFRHDEKWIEAQNALSKHPEQWTDEEWALQKEPIERFHDLIIEIRRLAHTRGLAYEYDLSLNSDSQLEISSHYETFRDMTRLLYSDALVRGHEANYGEAVDDILAVLNLAGILRDEPTTVAQLTAMAHEGMGNEAAERALPPEGLPPEIARRVIEYDGLADMRAKFADSFSGEGVIVLGLFEGFRRGEDEGSFLWNLYGSVFARPWLNADEETYADIIQRVGEFVRLPYCDALPRLQEIERDIGDLPFTRIQTRHSLGGIMQYSARMSLTCQVCSEAALDLMRIGLSIEQYHGTAGAFPPTLDAVSPMFGGRVPQDPFTGKPYRYQVTGASFLLYSVGPNLTDEGGVPNRKTGDIVWRGQEKGGG